jgi:PAS domain-containing protein
MLEDLEHVNKALCTMLGYSQNEMLGKTPFDFIDDENRIEKKKKERTMKKNLIVDDHAEIKKLVEITLGIEDFQILEAERGGKRLFRLRRLKNLT